MIAHPDTAALVRRLRRLKRLTQEQFAHDLGVSFSTVNQWENGHRRPQPYLLKRLQEMEASLRRESKGTRSTGGTREHER